MLNFTMGPVQSNECLRAIGADQVPYFRTPEFSSVLLESECLIKKLANAESDARAVFLTASGTAAMEAVVMNLLTKDDRALVVNGGSFGQRFADLCRIHKITFDEIKLNAGEILTSEHLAAYQKLNHTAFLVNLHETSTGVYYDISLISEFCKRNGIFLIVDAISSFLADPFDMRDLEVGAMISSSQKVLACPPGVSILLLSVAALKRVAQNHVQSMYFDLQDALKNGERGQTPFTPAVGILLQIHARLREIDKAGGVDSEIRKASALAADFRRQITELPLEIVSKSLSNTMTPLHPINVPANRVVQVLKDEYGIWVCPNGGDLKEKVFRVGHIGALTQEDNSMLIEALRDMRNRVLL